MLEEFPDNMDGTAATCYHPACGQPKNNFETMGMHAPQAGPASDNEAAGNELDP
jgi:hypothetical protein